MSKPAQDLFFISQLINLLWSESEILMYVSLIVPNRGDNILAKSAMSDLMGADSMPEMIGLKGMSGLWILGRP